MTNKSIQEVAIWITGPPEPKLLKAKAVDTGPAPKIFGVPPLTSKVPVAKKAAGKAAPRSPPAVPKASGERGASTEYQQASERDEAGGF